MERTRSWPQRSRHEQREKPISCFTSRTKTPAENKWTEIISDAKSSEAAIDLRRAIYVTVAISVA